MEQIQTGRVNASAGALRGGVHNANAGLGSRRATMSTTPYVGPLARGANLCAANEFTCTAYKALGTEFCVGHLRYLRSQQKPEVTE